MSLRPVEIPPFHRPGDSAAAKARVWFNLVDSDGNLLLGLRSADGHPISGKEAVNVTDTTVTLNLTPTTEIPGAHYHVIAQAGPVKEAYEITFGPSATPLTWAEIVAGSTPLAADEVSALTLHMADDDRHIHANERAALDAATAMSGANPVATINDVVAGGGGDMHTTIYDPTGVADDAFDLANFSGNLDGGVFT